MRKLLLFLALSRFTGSFGQQVDLQGKYSASFIGGETIEFVKKDSFYFGGFYCTYGVHGKGRCDIRGNYLYLYFEKSKNKPVEDSLPPVQISKEDTRDGICTIIITCFDNEGAPIPYASVVLKKDGKMIAGSMADDSGLAKFKVGRMQFPITANTSAVGVDPVKIVLSDNANYTIKVLHRWLKADDKELNNGEVYIYEIDELSEDSILMRPKGSNERFRNYRKQMIKPGS